MKTLFKLFAAFLAGALTSTLVLSAQDEYAGQKWEYLEFLEQYLDDGTPVFQFFYATDGNTLQERYAESIALFEEAEAEYQAAGEGLERPPYAMPFYLKVIGENGWELVGTTGIVNNYRHIFKRPTQ